jgi:hypothetical protein
LKLLRVIVLRCKATVVTRQKFLLVTDRENAKHHGFLSYQTYYVTLFRPSSVIGHWKGLFLDRPLGPPVPRERSNGNLTSRYFSRITFGSSLYSRRHHRVCRPVLCLTNGTAVRQFHERLKWTSNYRGRKNGVWLRRSCIPHTNLRQDRRYDPRHHKKHHRKYTSQEQQQGNRLTAFT